MASMGDVVVLGFARSEADELVVIDVSNPATPKVVWSLDVGADVNDLVLQDGKAFLATSLDDAELVVVDLARRKIVTRFDAAGDGDGLALTSSERFLWLGRKAPTDDPAYYMLDVSNLEKITTVMSGNTTEELTPPQVRLPNREYSPGGRVVARARHGKDPNLTLLAVDAREAQFQVVRGLDDDLVMDDINGDGRLRLSCVGDSNTFPSAWTNPHSWCDGVRSAISNPVFEVTSFAGLGATMIDRPGGNDARHYLEEALRAKPDLVIVALGTNDVGRTVNASPERIVGTMRELDELASKARTRIWFATLPPRPNPNTPPAAVETTNKLIERSFPSDKLVDFYTGFGPDDLNADGIHMARKGQLLRAERVTDRLRKTSPAPTSR